MAVSAKFQKIEMYISRKMQLRINSSKAIPEKSNKKSVTQVGRAILEQGKIRKYSDMKDIREREIERDSEREREIKRTRLSRRNIK